MPRSLLQELIEHFYDPFHGNRDRAYACLVSHASLKAAPSPLDRQLAYIVIFSKVTFELEGPKLFRVWSCDQPSRASLSQGGAITASHPLHHPS
ncbi:hypothetical protein JCM1840_000892 [Sporobolomyces johnsonii]